MSRSVSTVLGFIAILGLIGGLPGCGSGTSVGVFPVPASITLNPATSLSLEVGGVQSFSATAHDAHNPPRALLEPISFHSSNTAVVTVANNGVACAGTWNSLTAPSVCTPGPIGTAEVTAIAQGVSSPPTTVYVHQHIDSVVISPVPTNPPTTAPCVSKELTANYEATAFSRGADITPTVGQFTWTAVTPTVVMLNTTVPGLPLNQVQAKSLLPGMSQMFAGVGNTNSLPFNFIACPVQSISLAVTGTTETSFNVATGTSKSITATVIDSLGNTISAVPLSYCSSQPAVASTAAGTASNCSTSSSGLVNVSTPQPGAATITASCTPPTCNIGFLPSMPIYPTTAISATVSRNSTGTAPSGTVYVSSTGCGTNDGCISTIAPISFPTNNVATPLATQATPNSMVFSSDGKKAYLGTSFGLEGTRGVMVFSPTANVNQVQQFLTASNLPLVGKVLAVSPNGNKAILSDTNSTPNEVVVYDNSGSTAVAFQITGATAAAFSRDGLKAYIVGSGGAGCSSSAPACLYVYSLVDALQTIPLSAPVTDVEFLDNGIAGYMAGGSAAGMSYLATCADPASFNVGTVTAPGISMLRALPGGQMLLLAPPNIQTLTASVTGSPVQPSQVVGCPIPFPDGFLTINNATSTPIGLGQSFSPNQFLVSSDGFKAYIVSSNLSSILVFDVPGQTSSAIQLAGNALPLQASLTPEGSLLYVTTSDNMVHVLDTIAGMDVQQISLQTSLPATSLCVNASGQPYPLPTGQQCLPDMIAVRP